MKFGTATSGDVKHVHLSVHPPLGRVSLVAPTATRLEVARAYAISKLGWIRDQQEKLRGQARESPRRFDTREGHYLWGRRYLLQVIEKDTKPFVRLGHRRITLVVRPGSDRARRAEIMHEWRKSLLHEVIPPLIDQWQAGLGVSVGGYFLQRMKTKWGSCNHRAGTIRLNTELVKKPKDLLEYVVVHEMVHLLEPTHYERDVAEQIAASQPGKIRSAFFALCYGAGLEVSVALKVRRSDCNPDGREIRAFGTKAATRDRVVKVDAWAWERFWDVARRTLPMARVFPEQWSRFTVSDWHRQTVKALGLPVVHPLKNARHHWAATHLRAGYPIYVVQRQLGHSTAKLTLDTYGLFQPTSADFVEYDRQLEDHELRRIGANAGASRATR